MDEQQISKSEPVYLRLKGTQYLYDCFIRSCGPPRDSYFHMITYFDAFLFSYVSIEEMVDGAVKRNLNELAIFKFLKAARNITTHHSVLAAPNQIGSFERPFSRIIQDGNTGIASAKFRVGIEKFREMFTLAAEKYPRAAKGFQESGTYLQHIEENGKDIVYIDEIMFEGLKSVSNILGCST